MRLRIRLILIWRSYGEIGTDEGGGRRMGRRVSWRKIGFAERHLMLEKVVATCAIAI